MGEDLGTIPEGFRAMLHNMGMLSTEVMWFERDLTGFFAPNNYSRDAMATTTTHDLPTVAGWWSGHDIEDRLTAGVSDEGGAARERDTRRAERDALWRSFVANGATQSEQPPPSQSATAVNAAATFIGKASSPLVILPLNDAFGVMEQENMPGTFDEYPNWRHRLPGPASALAEAGAVSDRLAMTAESRPAKKA
jgi:4-alpha-glucanotransferase